MSVAIQLGNLFLRWEATGVGWNPDIADDLQNRVMDLLSVSLQEMHFYGMLDQTEYVLGEDAETADTAESEGDNG